MLPRPSRDQCGRACVPFFFKQWRGTNKKRAAACSRDTRGTRCRRRASRLLGRSCAAPGVHCRWSCDSGQVWRDEPSCPGEAEFAVAVSGEGGIRKRREGASWVVKGREGHSERGRLGDPRGPFGSAAAGTGGQRPCDRLGDQGGPRRGAVRTRCGPARRAPTQRAERTGSSDPTCGCRPAQVGRRS